MNVKHLKHLIFALTLTLTLHAGRANAQSAFTNALSFDGTSQHVTVPSGVWFSNQFSVESWVYVRSYASWSRLMDFGNGPGIDVVYCALSSGTTGQPTFGGYNGNGNSFGFVTAPSPLPTNTWVHLAFTCDGTTGRIYTNGILAASGAMTNAASAVRTNNFIGRSNWPADAYANAIFDEFRIWNTARSQAQIQANLGAPLAGTETNLLLYYRFDSTTGTVATNSATATGTAYNGTLVNGPTWVASTAPSTVVRNTNDAGAYSLRSAISNAPAGSTITFDPSLSGQTIRLTNGPLLLNKSYNIDASALAGGIIINGNATGQGAVFDSSSGFTNVLTALTITNGVTAAAAGGGGIVSRGNLTLNSCTLVGNSAGYAGGCIYNEGTLTLNQCTLAGNSTYASPGVGGAIYVASGTLRVNQSTITGNTANGGSGGGIYGTVNLTNSIVAGNTGGNISGSIFGNNNLTSGSPLLAALGNYGGPTPTMPPLSNSPAIDGCTSGTIFTTDQRGTGFPRVMNAYADIGAAEALLPSIPNSSFEANSFTVFPGYYNFGANGGITGWTPVGNAGLNPASGSPFADNGLTPHGVNVAFIQMAGSLSNTISGLTPGASYRVSFRSNSRASTTNTPTTTWSLNGSAFVPFTAWPSVNAFNTFTQPYYTNLADFTATSSTAALVVSNYSAADSAVLLDAFSVILSPITAPTVTTLAATGVTSNSATLNATVNPNGAATGYYFEYGTGTNYGSTTVQGFFAATNFNFSVTNQLSGLLPATTYHFRVVATNGVGAGTGNDLTFTTPIAAPTVTTLAATGVTNDSAMLNATVNPNGSLSGGYYFEYGTSTNYGSATTTNTLAATNFNFAVSSALTGLLPGTTYHFRVVAANNAGTAFGSDLTFTTSVAPPTVTTLAATGVNSNSATLNATVNPNGGATGYYFQYGLTTSYGSVTTTNTLAATNFNFAVSSALTGLLPGTTYHFRVAATNSAGLNTGNDLTFATPATAPAVVTLAATGMTGNSATLNATVNPNGAPSGYYFEYGTSTNYGSATATNTLAATNFNFAVSSALTGLLPGTTYHFRVAASNSVGFVVGGDLSFRTATTNIVTSAADNGGAGTLRSVISNSFSGDTIIFTNTLSGATILLTNASGVLILKSNLTIDASALADGIIINGNGTHGVFAIATTSTSTLTALTITNGNAVGAFGGGIQNDGTLTLNRSTVSGNTAIAGGGIFNLGTMTLNQNTFSGNTATGTGLGGGVANQGISAVLNQNTISGNSAQNQGGGIWNKGPLTLNHNTVSSNSCNSGFGSGIYNVRPTLITNSIIAGNTAGSPGVDIYNDSSSISFGGVNLVQSITNVSGATTSGNLPINLAPLLAPLGTYGGPTQTMPPQPGSPAIDGCTNGTSFTNDQRGLPRIFGTFADIGAVEYQPIPPTVTTLAATGVTGNSATVNATVNPNGASTSFYFHYGTTTNYGAVLSSTNFLAATNSNFSVSNLLSGLLPATTYHFRAAASNSVGFVTGNDQTFTTPALAPTVTTLAATGVTNTTGTLNGTVSPNAFATTAWFEWGATTNYGNQTTPVVLGSGNTPLSLSSNLTGFTPGITNHYRLVATNSVGTNYGGDIAFGSPIVTLIGAASLTNECHFAFTDPGATNSAGSAVSVSGSVNTNLPDIYLLTYTGTNTLGGVGTATRTVVVNDTLPPVVTVLGANPLTNLLNAPFVDPGATATDACAGNLAVVTNNTVNTGVAGFYTNTYTADDGNGHSTTTNRVVFVRGPATLMVLNNNDSGAGSLRQVIADSISGDTVIFTNTLSGATILLTSGQIVLNKSLTIDASALTNGISINGNHASRIFTVNSGTTTTLSGLTLTNGHVSENVNTADVGGAIYTTGTLTLTNCTLSGNSAFSGGGIFNAGTLALNQSTLSGNHADNNSGGGIFNASGTLTLNQSTLSGNSALGAGGIRNDGTLNVTNSIVCNNTASFVPNISSSFSGTNNLVNVNALLAPLGNYGGPTQTMPPLPGSPAIDGCTSGTTFTTDQRGLPRIVGAFAEIGAVELQTTNLPNLLVVNTTRDDLDSFFENGLVSLREAVFYATNGATITFSNTLSGATILLTNAGGELLLNKNLTIDGSALTNGISISGNNAHRVFEIASGTTNVLTALTITNGNSGGGDGGGIYNQGALTVNNCTLAGNSADTGAGIRNASGASLSVNQSTLANNTAGFGGGGIFNYGGTVIVRQSTVSANSALNGPGLFNDIFATMIISNSIVAGNTGFGSDIYDGGGGTFLSINNTIGGAPLLAPLGNYGGPTQTMPPLPGSPAIDGCTSDTTFTTDQRGLPRIVGAFADIGAVEVNWPTNVYVDPAKTWIGFMSVFTNIGGTADLNALFTGPTLTLTPNTSIDRDVPNDPYWWVGGAGGSPAKIMDASFYVQNDALAGGQTVIFSGYCTSNTLVSPYTSVAFIKDFVPDYSSFIQTNVAVATGQPFSIALATTAGHHVQYGFQTVGPNARLANVAALGKVTINSNAPVVPTVATLAASGVTNTTARLNGTVNPNGAATTAWFEWGATTSYGNQTTPVTLGSGNTPISFSNLLSGFTQGITNHYRLVATNASGTTLGNDIAFGSPLITLIGAANLTNECHTAFTDPGANNSAGFAVSVSGNLNTNLPNTYPLTYTGTNTLGGVGTATRTVVVNDTLPPVVTVLGANPLTNLLNAPFVDPGATAKDACAGNLPVVTNNTVNISVAGFYTNTYTANDGNGYSATNTRLVIVRGPQTNIVTSAEDDGGSGTLRSVITNSFSGDSVQFSNTLSGATILLTNGLFTSELLLNKNLTIDASPLTNGITVDGNGSSRVFNVPASSTVTLRAMTITNGTVGGTSGGGIWNSGNLTVNRCSILGNNSYYSGNGGEAGGIYNEGTIVINQCTFSKNYAYQGGSAIWNQGTAIVSQSTIADNYGTAVVNYDPFIPTATLTSSNSIIKDSVYGTIGGENNLLGGNPRLAMLGNYGGPTPTMPPLPSSPAIDGCTNGVDPNFTTDQRGIGFPRVAGSYADIGAVESGDLFAAAGRLVTVNSDDVDADFVIGVSLREAILYATNGGTITFTNTLSGATIILTNGELVMDKNLTIDASALPNGISIDGNNSSRVILVKPNRTVVLNSLTITNGAVQNTCLESYFYQPFDICVVGGGVANEGTLTMNHCTVVGCRNSLDGGRGAGIYNYGTLTLNQSTVASNVFGTFGYGIGICNDGRLTLNQSTIVGNRSDGVDSGVMGGGIANFSGITVMVNQSTLVGNQANTGGGIYTVSWFNGLDIFNSIIAGNSANSDANISGAYTATGVNLTNSTPLLAPLGNYGGPTPTMPPLTNSPAIDAGSDSATNTFATDQRGVGFPRLSGAHVDIGAVEYQFSVPVIIATNAPVLTSLTKLGNGAFQFSFTNLTGASFTVFGSTNVALPFAQWINLGPPVESPAGTFQFTDPQAVNNAQRFYRVTSP